MSRPGFAVVGADLIVDELMNMKRVCEDVLAAKAASMLAELGRRAFDEPGWRPSPWPPLSGSTLARAGAAADKAKKAREKAGKYRLDAYGHTYAADHLDGKARKSALRKAERARQKAKEWRGKAKEAKAGAMQHRAPLVDTGHMKQGLTSHGAKVTDDALGKDGFPYPVVHQFGSKDGRHPPARPFVPITPDGGLAEKAERHIRAALEAALPGIARQCGLK